MKVAFVAERLRRYVQVVVLFEGVGSSPTECIHFFFLPCELVAWSQFWMFARNKKAPVTRAHVLTPLWLNG